MLANVKLESETCSVLLIRVFRGLFSYVVSIVELVDALTDPSPLPVDAKFDAVRVLEGSLAVAAASCRAAIPGLGGATAAHVVEVATEADGADARGHALFCRLV